MESMKPRHIFALLLALSGITFATKEKPHLPCEYAGNVSRKYPNTAFAMLSEAMKQRATKRVDLSGLAKQVDITGTVGLDVLVDIDGSVVCAKGFYGHPVILKDVEEAVRQWKFKPLKEHGTPVAYAGTLYFELCNLGCGKKGMSMTLLK
jgi:hypothetical protein